MKTALHSISYIGAWQGQEFLDLESFIDKAADLGYNGVELTAKRPHLSVLDYSADRLAQLRKKMDDRHIECAAIAAYTDFSVDAAGGMMPFTEMQLIYIKALCEAAAVLKCDLIRIFTGYDNNSVPFFTQWSACIRAVQACCDIAAPYGINIGIQNHHDIAVDTAALREFVDEVNRSNCKVMLDPWSIALLGQDAAASVDLVRDKLVYSTFADYRYIKRHHYDPTLINYTNDTPAIKAVPMGEGITQSKEYLTLLQKSGFDGWIAYEMCSPLTGGGSMENLDSCAKRFLEFTKPFTNNF